MKNKKANCKINTFWNDLRVKNGIKIKDLSSYLGVNAGSVSKYITGKTPMPTNVIIKLADFFDIPIEEANKEAARLNTIHFSGDGRKRSIKKVEGKVDNKEIKEEKNDISYNNNKEVETFFFYVIDALANWSDDVLIEKSDELIDTLRAHKEALKFYIGKQKPDSQELLNAQHLILKIDILTNKIKNAVREKELKETINSTEDKIIKKDSEYIDTYTDLEIGTARVFGEENSSTSSDDMIELILDAVYGKVTREEYKKIEDYLRR